MLILHVKLYLQVPSFMEKKTIENNGATNLHRNCITLQSFHLIHPEKGSDGTREGSKMTKSLCLYHQDAKKTLTKHFGLYFYLFCIYHPWKLKQQE